MVLGARKALDVLVAGGKWLMTIIGSFWSAEFLQDFDAEMSKGEESSINAPEHRDHATHPAAYDPAFLLPFTLQVSHAHVCRTGSVEKVTGFLPCLRTLCTSV